jgi:FMN phosphatase YigB (HAD superfamily)
MTAVPADGSRESRPVVFLDVGATLVGADVRGPASRIGDLLGLDRDRRRALRRALMTFDFSDALSLADYMVGSLGAEPGPAQVAASEIWLSQETDAYPLPGASEALGRLVAEGWRIGLISNIWRPYLESVRSHYGALFDTAIEPGLRLFSFQLGYAKPDPRVFVEALRRAAVPAGGAVMIGDSYDEDIAPAATLGMGTVWVLTRPDDQAEATARVKAGSAPPPTLTVDSLDALDPRLISWGDG